MDHREKLFYIKMFSSQPNKCSVTPGQTVFNENKKLLAWLSRSRAQLCSFCSIPFIFKEKKFTNQPLPQQPQEKNNSNTGTELQLHLFNMTVSQLQTHTHAHW